MGVRKNFGRRRRPKNFGLFFGAKSRFQWGNNFFDLSGSEIFDISEFHGCKIWSIFNSGGRKFQRKLKFRGREIWRLFFGGTLLRRGNQKKNWRLREKKSAAGADIFFLDFFSKNNFQTFGNLGIFAIL